MSPNIRRRQFGLAALMVFYLGAGLGVGLLRPAIPRVGSETPIAVTIRPPTKPPAMSTYASTQFPAGNPGTIRFLQWTATLHPMFGSGDLDGSGNLVTWNVHACWPTSDEQLKQISRVRTIQQLALSAENVTDVGIRYVESMEALRELTMSETAHVSQEALDRLERNRPDLRVTCYNP